MPAAHARALADIDGDAYAAIAVVLDHVGLALAHRDGEAERFRHLAIAAVRARALCALEHDACEIAQLIGRTAETARPVAVGLSGAGNGACGGASQGLRHAGVMIPRDERRGRQQDETQAGNARAAGARRRARFAARSAAPGTFPGGAAPRRSPRSQTDQKP